MNDPESSLEQSEFHLFVSSVVSFKILGVNELKYYMFNVQHKIRLGRLGLSCLESSLSLD